MNNKLDLIEVLNHFPATLVDNDYHSWIHIGMALKEEGYSMEDWINWSRGGNNFNLKDCEDSWRSFNGSGITGGTLVEIAKQYGCYEKQPYKGKAIDWNGKISDHSFSNEVETIELSPPPSNDWDSKKEVIEFLSSLYEPDEYVNIVMESELNKKGTKYIPSGKGAYAFTAGQLLTLLENSKNVRAALGDYNAEAGAWVRINPLDGKGISDSNVTRFAYTLVEFDNIPIEEQNAKIRQSNLPVAFLVHSGAKSLHAIVKVDAKDLKEYKERVSFIQELFKDKKDKTKGADTSTQNPSRLCRLPGIYRGDKKQYIVDRNIGAESYDEWLKWYEEATDDLPDANNLASEMDNQLEIAPEVIEGIIRQGRKLIITAAPKAGKTFLLMELAVAIATGGDWLDCKCHKGKVLYINLELEADTFQERIKSIFYARNECEDGKIINPDIKNIITCHWRGYAAGISSMKKAIIRRAKQYNVSAIIIDPIYKVLEGDENSNSDVTKFCNVFDSISRETGCTMFLAHHHSKGNKKAVASMDRGSGAGSFARDADALVDLEMEETLADSVDSVLRIQEGISEDARLFCVETTLREFKDKKPFYIWFQAPLHIVDSGIVEEQVKQNKGKLKVGNKKAPQVDTRKRMIQDMYKLQKENLKEFGRGDENVKLSSMIAEFRTYDWCTQKYKDETITKWIRSSGLSVIGNDVFNNKNE